MICDLSWKLPTKFLTLLGYKMVKVHDVPISNTTGNSGDTNTMAAAIKTIAGRNHILGTIIDVGASNGSWSLDFMKYYPTCSYLLVEAQPVHEEALAGFCSKYANAQFVLAAAGHRVGEIHFHAGDPLGGVASDTPFASDNITVPVTTIDNEVEARNLPGPYLLKLDTHGFEVPILHGAETVLHNTEVIVVECYNFRITSESLLFYEMCNYLDGLGFRCIDMVDLLHRPCDGSLWQMDMVFVRQDRSEFKSNGYQ